VPQVNEVACWGRVIDYTSPVLEVVMARAGFILRFLKPCVVAVVLIFVASCGGGGAPPAPEVVRITVAGMPGTPLAPMQTVQLSASATYSDGTDKDVTTVSTWGTSDRSVLTVTSAGGVNATGPGKAEVMAMYGGLKGTAGAEVVALPAAYFTDGVEYAFVYELDAQGRVDSYRISQREGVAYATPAATWGCSASLRDDYACSRSGNYMSGEAGRLVRLGSFAFPQSTTYSYDGQRLTEVFSETQWASHTFSTAQTTLTYDGSGRLLQVDSRSAYVEVGGCLASASRGQITLDSHGRLSSEEGTPQPVAPCRDEPGRPWTRQWIYSAAGFLEQTLQQVKNEEGVVIGRRTVNYVAEPEGWLLARIQRVETDGEITSETGDTYSIVRFEGRVAEEAFTQAEPSFFYGSRRPQRVRYEWGRLPTEPLFVPRALIGLNGSDYFGIISSHHR